MAVLDYGIGNLRSAQKSLERVGADAHLTADRGLIADADAVVLPGVGAFGRCMEAIRATGLDEVAIAAAHDPRPFLGICVGLQMLYEASDESPGVPGLGVLEGTVRRLPESEKLPQMQWNRLRIVRRTSLFDDLDDGAWFYFVHSYAPEATDAVIATCDYGGTVTAAVAGPALVATQFHPEKSGRNGLHLLRNWVTSVAGVGAEARA